MSMSTGGTSTGGTSTGDPRIADLSGLRIAVVNWRDPWHPQAGGAERYAWEMARGLVVRGAKVVYLTARAPEQPRAEQRAGIGIVRRGGRFTVYPRVLGWLLLRRWSFDAVLDCQNGIPFFTPLVLSRKVPVFCLVHHVHAVPFGVHFTWWMANVGRFLEGSAARLVYRRHACVAVSPSAVAAMRRRLRWKGDIYLIPNGAPRADKVRTFLKVPNFPNTSTYNPKNLVWVGRLVAHKRAELLLPVAERLQLRLRNDRVVIDVVGHGPAGKALAAKVAAYGLDSTVRLRGFLPEPDKQALVAGSLLHLNTSQGEGWGLCVIEAAALGVPTVAYDTDGLRDAVRDGQTGWLVKHGETLADVVDRALKELSDPVRRAAIAANCRQWAAQFDWGVSTARMAALIQAAVTAGTSRAHHHGAWIVTPVDAPDGRDAEVLAEGPVLDALIAAGATVRRPATPLERLTGAGQPP
jgi:glycosyltransferase involved in cell wall biosynthesis